MTEDYFFNALYRPLVTPLLVKDRNLKHHTLEILRDSRKTNNNQI
jgi:hypothetical protein